MALNGSYTTLDTVLAKVRRDARLHVDEADAIEWVTEVMEMISPYKLLRTIISDGNEREGHPQPIKVTDYRAKLPCDMVVFGDAIEMNSFKKLRTSFGKTHMVNTTQNSQENKYGESYTPEFWYKNVTAPSWASPTKDGAYQLKDGYIYTDFKEGYLILVYKGWPMDEDENLMIPNDTKVIRAMASTIQMRIDYHLWRSGDIPDKIWNDSEQNYYFDIGAMDTHIVKPSQDEMHAISNFMRQTVAKDHYFETHFTSLGRKDSYRTH